MTSVNSPACLLARNHFYRNLSPSPETVKPVFTRQTDSQTDRSPNLKQRQVTIWLTFSTPPGFPGGVGTKGLWVSVFLGSTSSSRCTSHTKPTSPGNQGVK